MRWLSIFLLILLLKLSPATADCISTGKYFPMDSDLGFGNRYSKSLGGNFRPYGVCKATIEDGHPSRLGRHSIRFELKTGDCGWSSQGSWSDCQKDRARHELRGEHHPDGIYWYTWSLYLPEDFEVIFPTKLALGQFHQHQGHPVWMFQNMNGGYYIDQQITGRTENIEKLLDQDEMVKQWNDILVNAHWTHEESGFFKVWVNGTLKFSYNGPTKTKGKMIYQKFGLYQSFLSRYEKKFKTRPPDQIVYFDEVRTSKSCETLKLETLGYNCSNVIR